MVALISTSLILKGLLCATAPELLDESALAGSLLQDFSLRETRGGTRLKVAISPRLPSLSPTASTLFCGISHPDTVN